jgi:hypothetical protein
MMRRIACVVPEARARSRRTTAGLRAALVGLTLIAPLRGHADVGLGVSTQHMQMRHMQMRHSAFRGMHR